MFARSSPRSHRAFDSGGYTLVLPRAGTYQVTAGGGGLAAPVTETVRVGPRTNVRAEFIIL